MIFQPRCDLNSKHRCESTEIRFELKNSTKFRKTLTFRNEIEKKKTRKNKNEEKSNNCDANFQIHYGWKIENERTLGRCLTLSLAFARDHINAHISETNVSNLNINQSNGKIMRFVVCAFSICIILVLYFRFYFSTHVWTLFILNRYIYWICFCCWLCVVFSFYYYYSCVYFFAHLLLVTIGVCVRFFVQVCLSLFRFEKKNLIFFFIFRVLFFVVCCAFFFFTLKLFTTRT